MSNMKNIDIRANVSPTGLISNPGNKDIFRMYITEVAKISTLSREEEHQLFLNVKKNNCRKSIDLLCKHNLKFVISIAKTYNQIIFNTILTLEDLICEGNIGLCNAIHKFDCNSENKFISYAVWHIRQMILKCISDNIKSIRVPGNIKNDIAKINIENIKLIQKLGREPEITELYEYCMLNIDFKYGSPSYKRFCSIVNNNNKFDKLLSEKANSFDDSTATLADNVMCKESNNTIDSIFLNDNKDLLHKLLNTLAPRASSIIKIFYGINCEHQSMPKIADKYGVTTECVRQIINKGIKTLKTKHHNINPYV